MIEDQVRPLTTRERSALNMKIADARHLLTKTDLRQNAASSFGCCGLLWVLTIIAIERTWQARAAATALWLIMAVVYTVWGYYEDKRKHEVQIKEFESALKRNEARDIHIQTDEMVELAEEDDEGARYAFQVEPDKILFLAGQDYYEGRKFPNSDFYIVMIYAEKGSIAHRLFDKKGKKLKPLRTIPVEAQKNFRLVEDLEIMQGRLENLEQLLAK